MSEIKVPPFEITKREDIEPYVANFKNKEIFSEITDLLGNNEMLLTFVREKVADHLDMSIMATLKVAFENHPSGKKWEEFLLDLIEKETGAEQVRLIEEEFKGADGFWTLVEQDLQEGLLFPLLADLRQKQSEEDK